MAPPPPPTTPTATLTANGSSDITVNVGDTIRYAWSSTNGSSATSTVTDNGVGPYAWTTSSLSGSATGGIGSWQAGHTYVITYKVIGASGATASASITVRVRVTNASVPPTSFMAAVLVGMQSVLTQISDMLAGMWRK